MAARRCSRRAPACRCRVFRSRCCDVRSPVARQVSLGCPAGACSLRFGVRRVEAWSLSRQNGEATVAPLTPLRLSAHAVEKAKLSRLRVRDEVALLAAAEPVNATSPIAPALVAAKIAAPVRITVWRDVSFAMSQTPSLLTAFSSRQTTLVRDFFRVRSRSRIDRGERPRAEGSLFGLGNLPNQGQMLQFMGVRRSQRDEVTSSGVKVDSRLRYGGEWFAAASTLLSDGGGRPRRLARFVVEAARRPRRAAALIALILRTRSEYVCLSESEAGEALRVHFDGRRFAVFPGNRLCQGVLILPRHHAEYLRGHHRQALRTNLRRAATAGIRCERVDDPSIGLATALDMLRRRCDAVSDGDVEFWRTRFAQPELTLTFAYDERGHPLAFSGAVIDDTVCLIKFALATDHRARWALHDHLVRILIGRGVTYLLAAGGGAFGALGFAANLQHYQRLLGYELRHMIPATANAKVRGPRRVAWLVAVAATATLIMPSAATCATDGGRLAPRSLTRPHGGMDLPGFDGESLVVE